MEVKKRKLNNMEVKKRKLNNTEVKKYVSSKQKY